MCLLFFSLLTFLSKASIQFSYFLFSPLEQFPIAVSNVLQLILLIDSNKDSFGDREQKYSKSWKTTCVDAVFLSNQFAVAALSKVCVVPMIVALSYQMLSTFGSLLGGDLTFIVLLVGTQLLSSY